MLAWHTYGIYMGGGKYGASHREQAVCHSDVLISPQVYVQQVKSHGDKFTYSLHPTMLTLMPCTIKTILYSNSREQECRINMNSRICNVEVVILQYIALCWLYNGCIFFTTFATTL